MGFGKEKWATVGINVKIIMELKCQVVKPSRANCMKPTSIWDRFNYG